MLKKESGNEALTNILMGEQAGRRKNVWTHKCKF